MKKILFHIGTPKTGTTTLQNTVMNHAELLRKHGVHVTPRATLNEVQLMLQDNMDSGVDNLPAIKKIIQSELKCKEDILLMSHEAFAGVSYIHPNSIADMYAGHLARLFEDNEVKIIVYLRRQDLFMESRYTQSVKNGLDLSFADYLGLHAGNHNDWGHLVDAYAAHFGVENIIVKAYERSELKDGDIVADFVDTVGLPDALLSMLSTGSMSAEQQNTSYNGHALKVHRVFNQQFFLTDKERKTRLDAFARTLSPENRKTKADYRRVHQALARGVDPEIPRRLDIRHVLQKASFPCQTKPLLFTNNERERYLDTYRDSNNRIARSYLGRPELFSNALPKGERVDECSVDLTDLIIAYGNALADHRAEIVKLKEQIRSLEAKLKEN
ncbi:hypothetical protein SAMN02745704_00556 [Paucidesulfovibrio gracilis DSM 16080]|uniref:Uncharacterized protein n=1 Tax=Paucidesulfovibrio gracilis DSM 16080 TaxID=1121449 RepID=A0A1T4W9D5_9BACT|nr:hypothetical protein [Paucidesulfovibrio gracilis]SKA73924.1 hypothetical protein SAMN02745704_00556 [Paucidesulfovibrio gracilis DSM 16080]